MKRFAALIGAGLLAIAGYGIAAHHNITTAATPAVTLPDEAYGAAPMQMSFVHQGDPGIDRPFLPSGAPAITREDAIQAVASSPYMAGRSGYTLTAKYGLFSAPVGTKNPDGSFTRLFDHTPEWLVRAEGLHFALPGGPSGSDSRGYIVSTLDFVVDPTTGKLLDNFTP